jgi:Flp pilus assembly protein TadB
LGAVDQRLATFPKGGLGHGRNVPATNEEQGMSNKPVKAKSSGLRVLDGAAVVVAGVVGVVILFAGLHFIAGVVWELVKVAVLVGVVGGLVWVLGRRRHRDSY